MLNVKHYTYICQKLIYENKNKRLDDSKPMRIIKRC